jgi:hypothetical protein
MTSNKEQAVQMQVHITERIFLERLLTLLSTYKDEDKRIRDKERRLIGQRKVLKISFIFNHIFT